jgi:hypothetical protein
MAVSNRTILAVPSQPLDAKEIAREVLTVVRECSQALHSNYLEERARLQALEVDAIRALAAGAPAKEGNHARE